jgi:hypothetical protein
MAHPREKIFGLIAGLVCKRPGAVLGLALVFAAIGVALASQLGMHTSRIDLLSSEHRAVKSYTDFTAEFGTANNIFFIIEGPSLITSKRCADALAEEISGHPSYIRDTLHRFDLARFKSRALLYLSPEQIVRVEEYLDNEAEFLEKLIEADDLNDVLFATEAMAEKRAEQGFQGPATNFELSALAGLLDSLNSYIWGDTADGVDLLPGIVAGEMPLGIANDSEGYLVGRNGRTVILLARPVGEKEDSIEVLRPMMAALVEAKDKVLVQFPEVSIQMTGLPTFAYGDLRVMENEMPVLSLAALVAVIAVFFLFSATPWKFFSPGLRCLLLSHAPLG